MAKKKKPEKPLEPAERAQGACQMDKDYARADRLSDIANLTGMVGSADVAYVALTKKPQPHWLTMACYGLLAVSLVTWIGSLNARSKAKKQEKEVGPCPEYEAKKELRESADSWSEISNYGSMAMAAPIIYPIYTRGKPCPRWLDFASVGAGAIAMAGMGWAASLRSKAAHITDGKPEEWGKKIMDERAPAAAAEPAASR